MIRRHRYLEAAFALPTILIASVVMIIVMLASIQSVISVRVALDNQYYDKISQEAVESGLAMAIECIKTDNSSWASPLKPNTSCNGTVTGGSAYLIDTPNLRTSFQVAVGDFSSGSTRISTTSTVELLRTSNSLPWKTYTQTGAASVSYPNLDISSGNDTTCAAVDGDLYCWGKNDYSQIGDGTTTDRSTPVRVNYGALAGKYVYSVASGLQHTCALAGTGSTNTARTATNQVIYCWGRNDKAQMGLNAANATIYSTPVAAGTTLPLTITDPDLSISTGLIFTALSASYNSCVIGKLATSPSKSRAWCWGDNATGEGIEDFSAYNPKLRADVGNATSAAGDYALRYSRNNTATDSTANSTLLTDPISINVVSNNNGCIITITNKALCWGGNTAGMLGVGTVTDSSVAKRWRAVSVGGTTADPITSPYRFSKVVTNWGRACAIGVAYTSSATGRIYCWGSNGSGSVDYRQTSSLAGVQYGSPQLMPTPSGATFKDIAVSDWTTCGIRSDGANDGKIYCWGYNNAGQLGIGVSSGATPSNGVTPSPAPGGPATIAQVAGVLASKKAVAITSGNDHFCAMTYEGATYCWGANNYGQLGDGTTTNRSVPTRIKVPIKISIY